MAETERDRGVTLILPCKVAHAWCRGVWWDKGEREVATRAEKTKEQKIKTEKTRLKGIFKELDENKKKLVTPLIEKAAEAETYIALSKNYAAIIKQLTELVPAAKRKKSRLAALREE